MQDIPINRTREDLLRQFSLIKQVENFNYKTLYGNAVFTLIVLALLVLILFLFTNSDSFVILKAVSFYIVGILWVLAFSFAGFHLIKRIQTNGRIKKVVDLEIKEGVEYYMNYSEQELIYGTNNYRNEIRWSHFAGYLETPTIIFLFQKGSIYSCVLSQSLK